MVRGTADTASIISQNTVSSSGGSRIYARGPQFSLDSFLNKDFIVKDFVEALSDNLNPAGQNQATFDPKPHIRTFEYALSRLSHLSDQRESHENELSLAVRRAETQHRQHCVTLQHKLDQALESFNTLEFRLESTLESVPQAKKAFHFGERLQELDKQKRYAEDAKFLIQCWQDAAEHEDLSRLEDTKRLGGGSGKVRCAQIARQLLRIGNELGRDCTALEKFLERLEQDLLEQFEESRNLHNENAMRDCAVALYDFSGGASVTARFVNQHEFFLEPGLDVNETWDNSADPDSGPSTIESSLQAVIDQVRLVLQEESFVIRKVFPFYEQVLTTFIERAFQQSIQQKLEVVLEKALSASSLSFLRALHSARSYTNNMVDELKSHGLTEHPDAASIAISNVLDRQLEDLFVPYTATYIETEKRNLEELYSSLLYKFTLYHSKKRKSTTATLGQRGRELLVSARDRFAETLKSSDLAQKETLLRLAGISDESTDVEVSEEDGTLSLPTAKRMLSWLAEAVGRTLELTLESRDVAVLSRVLMTNMLEMYVEIALETINDTALAQESLKTEPDLAFFRDLRVAVNILDLAVSSHSILLPMASANVTVRREIEKSTMVSISRIEDRLAVVRSHGIEVALNWTAKLLARQARTDFRPRDEIMDQFQTATCESVFVFLNRIRDLYGRDAGKNVETFFTELAIGFRSLLFEHFCKFQVNLAGGLVVSKDINKYIELLRSFPTSASFRSTLEVLVEIGNIFVIGPEALKERLRGGSSLTGIDRADLRPYILKREDANSVGVQSLLSAL